jgi:hypothetical protein
MNFIELIFLDQMFFVLWKKIVQLEIVAEVEKCHLKQQQQQQR